MNNTINLSSYFPKEFDIISSIETNESNQIRLCVSAQEIHCPSCNSICKWNYKTHIRRIIDLPILGKPTNLIIVVKQYECKNDNCPERVLFSTIEGFTEPYRRMTKRCEDIVCAIALNMNCESASRICKIMGIQVSGDTIIRILLRRFSELPENNCSEIIGVDDWALSLKSRIFISMMGY